jgi:hypothetical protein
MAPQTGMSSNNYIDKVHFKYKIVRRDKEGHFTLIKGTIHQEEIASVNLCVPYTKGLKNTDRH